MMKMATALIQCMMRTGNGCRRRGEAACGGVILDNAVACDIGCYPQLPVRHKTAKKPALERQLEHSQAESSPRRLLRHTMIANLVFASRTPSQTRAAFLIDDHCRKDRAVPAVGQTCEPNVSRHTQR